MDAALWCLAVVLFIVGCVNLASKAWLVGVVLIITAFLVGPGGVSLLS